MKKDDFYTSILNSSVNETKPSPSYLDYTRDPNFGLENDTLHLIATFFLTLIKGEMKRQELRVTLLHLSDFNPLTLFQRVDRGRKGFILKDDLIKLCYEWREDISPKELTLLFQKKQTSYDTFLKVLLDKKDQKNVQFFNERNLEKDIVVRKIDYLSDELERGLVKFLKDMIEVAKEEEQLKSLIKEKPDFIPLNVFKKIKRNDGESIQTEDILKLLVNYDIALSEEEVQEYLLDRKVRSQEMSFASFCNLFSFSHTQAIVHSNKKSIPRSSKVQHQLQTKSHVRQASQVQNTISNTFFKPSQKQKLGFKVTSQVVKNNSSLRYSLTPGKAKKSLDHISFQRTQDFKTDYISPKKVIQAFLDYIMEQVTLDDQLERIKIGLISEKDLFMEEAFLDMLNAKQKGYFDAEDVLELIIGNTEQAKLGRAQLSVHEVESFLQKMCGGTKVEMQEFGELICPRNAEFNELFMDRQGNFSWMHDQSLQVEKYQREKFETSFLFKTNLKELLADSMFKMILNFKQNKQIRETFAKNSKGQGKTVLRFIAMSCEEAVTWDQFLEFLQDKLGERIGKKEETYLKVRFFGSKDKRDICQTLEEGNVSLPCLSIQFEDEVDPTQY